MSLEGTILGHYRLLRPIGSGGMGEVYLAEDTRIARQVAVKVVRSELDPYPNAPSTQEATRLFQREMKAIASLDHPNILPLIDFGEQAINRGTYTYLVMPYRPDGSLVDWLQTHGGGLLPPEEVVFLVIQAADALQHAHDHQIVHLDVKGSNFLVRIRQGRERLPDLLLADFGIARFNTATSTASQNIRGTPAAMAPEQWAGKPVAASDQYALAVMTYQLLTGTVPFQGNMQQMMYQHIQEMPQPPSTHNPRISSAVDAVLLRALAKKPEERFPSVQAFALALQNTQENDTPTVRNTPASLSQSGAEYYIPTAPMTPAAPFQAEENIPTTRISPPPPPPPPPQASFVQARVQPPLPQRSSAGNKLSRTIILVLVVIILLLGGTVAFAFTRFQGSTTPSGIGSQLANNITPATTPLPTATTAATQAPTVPPTSATGPISTINYGKLLYTTSTPSGQCDKAGGQWADYNQPGLQCSAAGTTISNPNSTSPNLVGTFLTTTPNGTYPNDYVIEAQMQQANTSSDAGIYFRNQPGNQQGVYTFFIHPNGTWGAYVYDNASGAQTQIASGATSMNAHSLLRVTVVIMGTNFTFYVNRQRVGTAYDRTYGTGTAGIAVDAGGTVLVRSFSLYAVA
jgi:serine/threonine protein kinase